MQRLRPPFLTLVSIPTWLASKSSKDQAKIYRERRLGGAGQASYVLDLLFKRLRRQLKKVEPPSRRRSEWTDYVSFNKSHAPDYLAEKQAFVEHALREFKPRNFFFEWYGAHRYLHSFPTRRSSVRG